MWFKIMSKIEHTLYEGEEVLKKVIINLFK